MSTQQNLTFHEGEPWQIDFIAHTDDGSVMPLPSGTEVEFRVSGPEDVMLTQYVGHGVTIMDEVAGTARITVLAFEQADAELRPTIPMRYEIRVTTDDTVSIQATGRLIMLQSLFGGTTERRIALFRVRVPEFTDDDAIIGMALEDAADTVDEDTSWNEDQKDRAAVYLAAHNLKLRKDAAEEYSVGALTGDVRVIRVEDRMIGFDTTKGTTMSAKTGLAETIYGRMYLQMLRSKSTIVERM